MAAPLPPGSAGLPLLGETIDFVKNGFEFVAGRVAKHGPIFRTSLLGRKAVVMSGPDAVAEFIDPGKIQREGSFPPHVQELFGGRSLPLLDGEVHRTRKTIVLSAFSREALEAYLPAMQEIVETHAARWASSGEFRWIPALKKLSLEAIGTNVAGITDPDELERIHRDYLVMGEAFSALPIRLPGTAYTRALAARDRIFAVFQRQVTARRRRPETDGLSRMLAAAATLDPGMADTAVVLELHHAVIAGFIVFGELAAAAIEVGGSDGLRTALREEIARHAPPGPLRADHLMAMPRLLHTIMETTRLTPIIPVSFGIARRTFSWNGVTVPKGWTVMLDIRGTNRNAAVYTDASRFDPQRYAPGREEHTRHEHAFTPQGGGPPLGHRCAGVEYSTMLMATFLVVMLRGYQWALPPQRLELDWSVTPPEPVDGLRVVVKPA